MNQMAIETGFGPLTMMEIEKILGRVVPPTSINGADRVMDNRQLPAEAGFRSGLMRSNTPQPNFGGVQMPGALSGNGISGMYPMQDDQQDIRKRQMPYQRSI